MPTAWNEAHWVDREFDELFKQASGTFDVNKRKAIM
jgi:ABC-type transport system substrate-binding protein